MDIDRRAGQPGNAGVDARPGAASATVDAQADTRSAAQDGRAACPACGGRLSSASVSTALWEGEALSVVRNVPALVCRSCHERYFDDHTVMRLDLMRAGGFGSETAVAEWRVPVYAFPAAGEDPP